MVLLVVLVVLLVCDVARSVQVTWCTTGSAESMKCSDLSKDYKKAGSELEILCEGNKTGNDDDCLVKLATATDKYYIKSLDAGYIYKAILNNYNIKVVLAEDHGVANKQGQAELASYFAVAVVRSGRHIDLRELKNLKTCHTGYYKTSGWNIPVGYLAGIGELDFNDRCNDVVYEMSRYVHSACLPDNTAAVSDDSNLCELCSTGTCSKERDYAGYSGAFRCLVEGGGDVAFVKHTTVPSNTDGKNTADWAAGLNSSDFRLLCADGNEVTVDNFASCNLALVPAHALVVTGDMSQSDIEVLQRELRNPPPIVTYMFNSTQYSANKDLLFKDSTTQLVYVYGHKQTPQGYLDRDYIRDMNDLNCIENSAVTLRLQMLAVLAVALNILF